MEAGVSIEPARCFELRRPAESLRDQRCLPHVAHFELDERYAIDHVEELPRGGQVDIDDAFIDGLHAEREDPSNDQDRRSGRHAAARSGPAGSLKVDAIADVHPELGGEAGADHDVADPEIEDAPDHRPPEGGDLAGVLSFYPGHGDAEDLLASGQRRATEDLGNDRTNTVHPPSQLDDRAVTADGRGDVVPRLDRVQRSPFWRSHERSGDAELGLEGHVRDVPGDVVGQARAESVHEPGDKGEYDNAHRYSEDQQPTLEPRGHEVAEGYLGLKEHRGFSCAPPLRPGLRSDRRGPARLAGGRSAPRSRTRASHR